MVFDEKKVLRFYANLPETMATVRAALGRPLTLSEKILYAHACAPVQKAFERGTDYVHFSPDRVAMQDATAQMALLQLMNSGREKVAVPTSVHCDHLIQAHRGATSDVPAALSANKEVYDFLRSVSSAYGIDFWEPDAGIIHQVVLENYAFPGGMMVGTDSHTPNAGGLGMLAIGVGGADAVDVMASLPWELKMPRIIGVRLTGTLSGWASPKDVILKLAGILTVKGGTNAVIEYFGPGTESLSATGKATVCNMGAEVGATASLFPYDGRTEAYLLATQRASIAEAAQRCATHLQADAEVLEHPEAYFDRLIEIDLSALEPHINGPFTPDAAAPLSAFAERVRTMGYPPVMEVGLIGSCTNSSYEDLTRAAEVIRSAQAQGLKVKAQLLINPGSEQVRRTAERDGILAEFERAGAVIMANACGPCIGQWKREMDQAERPNSIVTSFNRNFAKRNDGNPGTQTFIASPEIVAALSVAGDLCFNPLRDELLNEKGEWVTLNAPVGKELPEKGFEGAASGYTVPSENGSKDTIRIDPHSERLQLLTPFEPWEGSDFTGLGLLIQATGKCTTDHISMAGPWLRFRGHLDRISDNLLMGAVNRFNGKTNAVLDPDTGNYTGVSTLARTYQKRGQGSIVVAEENYGEGSSREHAAMEPRHLHVKAILAKSFARIHETNLKKQGMLALTFSDPSDYDRIREDDRFDILGLTDFTPGKPLTLRISHSDGSTESLTVRHTFNQQQIGWFKAGSALNVIQ